MKFNIAGPHFSTGQSSNGRNLDPMEMVYVFLYSGSGDMFQRHAEDLSGMSQTSVCHSVEECLKVFYDHVVPLYNVLPTEEEARGEADEFHQYSGFPMIGWGAIDGTHIDVSPASSVFIDFNSDPDYPKEGKQCFICRQFSMSLL